MKRGQVFLIASLIIVGVLISLSSIYNSVNIPHTSKIFFNLPSEINFEESQVLDWGTLNSLSSQQLYEYIENLTDYYSLEYPSNDILAIIGNTTNIFFITYENKPQGSVSISFGGSPVTMTSSSTIKSKSDLLNRGTEKEVNLTLNDNINYTFNIRDGQFFYMFLKKEKNGERFIVSP